MAGVVAVPLGLDRERRPRRPPAVDRGRRRPARRGGAGVRARRHRRPHRGPPDRVAAHARARAAHRAGARRRPVALRARAWAPGLSSRASSGPRKASRSSWAAVVAAVRPSATAVSSSATRPGTPGCARNRSSSVSVTSLHIHATPCSARSCVERFALEPGRGPRRSPSTAPATPAPVRAEHVSDRTSHPGRLGRSRWTALRRSPHGALGGAGQVAVGLVDDDEVGQLHDPALDALELVAAGRARRPARTGRRGRRPRPRTGRRRPSRRARRRSRRPRTAAAPRGCGERRRRACPDDGRRADEGRRVAAEVGHPGLVAEDRAAGDGARRVDGEHRDPVAGVDGVEAERLDQRRLARRPARRRRRCGPAAAGAGQRASSSSAARLRRGGRRGSTRRA